MSVEELLSPDFGTIDESVGASIGENRSVFSPRDLLAALFFFLREVRHRFREGADDVTTYWIRVGATGLVAIALQEFVDFSFQMPGNAVLFTVLAAIAIHRPPPKRPQTAL